MDNKRGEGRKRWVEAHGGKAVPSMKRRKAGHDYCSVCMYMITICVAGRRPVLGTLRDSDSMHERTWVETSAVGTEVHRQWKRLKDVFPQVQPLWIQVMPDHVHGILYVKDRLSRPLGHVVSYFKARCTAAMRELSSYGETESRNNTALWEQGFNDRILKGAGQLDRWVNYLKDNPRRLWVKRHHREWFTARHGVTIGKWSASIMGNQFLLDSPDKMQVQCSRRLSEQEISALGDFVLEKAANGTIIVSPCISPGEKIIMKRVFDAGFFQIILLENGFSPMSKPHGRQFDACAEGRLLLVAPWEYHGDRRAITRSQCLELNELAAMIVNG